MTYQDDLQSLQRSAGLSLEASSQLLAKHNGNLAAALADIRLRSGSVASTSSNVTSLHTPAMNNNKTQRKTGIATFASLASSSQDAQDEDSDDDSRAPNLYAGGEKSGLAVQDPTQTGKSHNTNQSMASKILQRAAG